MPRKLFISSLLTRSHIDFLLLIPQTTRIRNKIILVGLFCKILRKILASLTLFKSLMLSMIISENRIFYIIEYV